MTSPEEIPRSLVPDGGIQARLARILEATTDFVAICTVDGGIIYLNQAGRQLAGIGLNATLDGLNLEQLHPEWAFAVVSSEGVPEAVENGVWRGETAVLTRDGFEVPVSQLILAHDGPEGEVEFISTVIRDISDRKREEVERIEWANRYDAAIRASGQLLFDWNCLTNELTYGGNSELFLGYSLDELGNGLENLRRLIHPDDLASFDDEIQRVTATRDPFSADFRLRRKDGVEIYVHGKGYFFLDRQGRLSRMIGFFGDVTDRRRAAEALGAANDRLEARVAERTAQLAQSRALIEERARQQEAVARIGQRALAGAPVLALMEEAVQTVCEVLRVDMCCVLELSEDREELLTRAIHGWPEATPLTSVPTAHSLSGYSIQTGDAVVSEDLELETRFRAPEKLLRAGVRCGVAVKIAAGEQPMGALSAFDFRLRNYSKDDVLFLQSIANVLTAAIARQHAEESIQLARDQAETANRAKSEFLSRMSHELRTPLNAILGFTQLLELEASTPTQAESIEHISRAGRHLLSLINEVLDIARVESGRLALHPEPIRLGDVLSQAVQLIRPLAHRFEIPLDLEADCGASDVYVMADQQRFKQVLMNLLSNAVKYNRPGGRVIVRCQCTEGRTRITVEDTGKGIPIGKMPRLFTPFDRLGAEATDIEGAGVGLALSRGIMTALQGEIGADSIDGKGSTFWVELPSTEPPVLDTPPVAATAVPPPPARTPEKTFTLLYIEDQDLNLRLVERILLHHPQYKLLSSMQGRLGLDLAREHQPDLILLDLNLPDMPGDEILMALKSDPDVSEIPVIMVSADALGDRIETLIAAGATGYLSKPYRVNEFLRLIRETLGGKA